MIGTGFNDAERMHLSSAAAGTLPPSRYGRPGYRWTKRIFDIVVALLLLVILFPLFVVVGLLIAAHDGFPVIYRHRRVGQHGRTIHILKFRSMVKNAEKVLEADPVLYAEFLKTFKLEHDPRVTKVGAFLRKTSLDEIPQLLNVLAGEMSLVGPRPVVLNELQRYEDREDVYLATFPGCAGLWQCSGRSDTTYQERIRLDLEYYENASFWNDVSILIRTAVAVVAKKGAH